MSRQKSAPDYVARCVPRQDGGYLIVTRSGQSGVSPVEVAEGARVLIEAGKAVRG